MGKVESANCYICRGRELLPEMSVGTAGCGSASYESGRSLNQSGYKSEDALQTCLAKALTFKAAFSLELPGGWL
jgi:hypothetical protein